MAELTWEYKVSKFLKYIKLVNLNTGMTAKLCLKKNNALEF